MTRECGGNAQEMDSYDGISSSVRRGRQNGSG